MKLLIKIGFVLSGLIFSFWVQAERDTIQYSITLTDPVQPELQARNYQLILNLDEHGFPENYRLSITNYICMDKICKPITVKLFWNALGDYLYLEYPENLPLTKSDHEEFTQEDYLHLDAILKDKGSILEKYPVTVFGENETNDNIEADAVSGATPQEIINAVVEDAAYTSWALWHWVNGEIVDEIFERTLTFCDRDYILHCLKSSDPQFENFALMQVDELVPVDNEIREACFEIIENSGWSNSKLAIQILTKKPVNKNELHHRLIELYGKNAGSNGLILNYFENASNIDPALWVYFAGRLNYISSYSDVFAALVLIRRYALNSRAVKKQVETLLESDDPYIAARAKEFLETKP